MFQGELMSSDIKMPLKKKMFLFKIKKSTCGITSYILVVCNKGEGGGGKGEGVREKEHPASGNLRTQVSCLRKYLYNPLKKSFVPKPPPPQSTSMEILLFLNTEIKVGAYKCFFFVFLLNLQPLSIYVLISFASTSLSFSVKILIMLFPMTIKSPLFTSSV